jgi:hypothetical protein
MCCGFFSRAFFPREMQFPMEGISCVGEAPEIILMTPQKTVDRLRPTHAFDRVVKKIGEGKHESISTWFVAHVTHVRDKPGFAAAGALCSFSQRSHCTFEEVDGWSWHYPQA